MAGNIAKISQLRLLTYLGSRVIETLIHIFSHRQTSVSEKELLPLKYRTIKASTPSQFYIDEVIDKLGLSSVVIGIGNNSGCSLLLRHKAIHKAFSGVSASIRQPLGK